MSVWMNGWMDDWVSGHKDTIWHFFPQTYRCDLLLMLTRSYITKIIYPSTPTRMSTAVGPAARSLTGSWSEQKAVFLKNLELLSQCALLAHRVEVSWGRSTGLRFPWFSEPVALSWFLPLTEMTFSRLIHRLSLHMPFQFPWPKSVLSKWLRNSWKLESKCFTGLGVLIPSPQNFCNIKGASF